MEMTLDGQRRMLVPEDEDSLARIEYQAAAIARDYGNFQYAQTEFGMQHAQLAQDKQQLEAKLNDLRGELDSLLAKEYGIDSNDADAYKAWQDSHQPFHWFVEFHGIMSRGGFDVVVGNPPYVQWRKVRDYTIRGYRTSICHDIYAACVERSTSLSAGTARYGMILPISFQFSDDFGEARAVVDSYASEIWVSTFSRNPAALFNTGLGVRSTIVIVHASREDKPHIFTTRLNRWVEDFRPILFENLEYGLLPPSLARFGWPRTGNNRISKLFEELAAKGSAIGDSTSGATTESHSLRFKATALYYVSAFVSDPPSFDQLGVPISQTQVSALHFPTPELQRISSVLALGKIALLWWATTGDDFHVTASGLASIPIGIDLLGGDVRVQLDDLSRQIQDLLDANVIYTRYAGKWMGNYDVKCVRELTDVSDRLVLESLGLGDYWDDLELEYVRFLKMTGERPGTTRSLPEFERQL